MLRIRAIVAFGTVVAALSFLSPSPLRAQGVTTGAITGNVIDESGEGVENAQVQVVNRATGFSAAALTRVGGRYFVQGLEVGSQYAITVRQLGYAPQTRENLRVTLGTVTVADFRLVRQATELAGVTVTADLQEAIFSPSRTGTGTLVSDSALRRLPTLNRNFTDFVALTPQVSQAGPGLSGGGVNNRFNSIQIDGTNSSDIFGLGSTGQPGGQAGGKSISLEAVKEYQVLLTPFDVRQGNFAGALINAVTKSGTNDFAGTAYYYTRSNDEELGLRLTRDVDFLTDYEKSQYGFSFGGPIVRDRAHFFVAPEWQEETRPASGPYLGQPTDASPPLTVSEAELTRFQQLLQRDNIDAGSAGFFNLENPLANVFGRVDVGLPWNSRLVLSHNYAFASQDVFSRSGDFALSSFAYFFQSTNNKTAAQVFTSFDNGSFNEFAINFSATRDRRTPRGNSPQIFVGRTSTPTLVAGSERFSQGNELDQDVWEVKDDFSFSLGAHRFTVGTQNQFFEIRNLFNRDSYGVYWFNSLDSLDARNPRGYSVSVDLGGGIPVNLDAAQYAVYAQDQWQTTPKLSLTYGLRVDVPVLDSKPALSQRVLTAFGRRTDEVPSGNVLWSPRVGFNWDISSERRTQLRGGVGMFAGRPAFVWVSNAYQNSGTGLGLFVCGRTAVTGGAASTTRPVRFEPDPNNQPDRCADATTGVPAAQSFAESFQAGTGRIDLIDLLSDDLKFPQTLRATLGLDRELFAGIVATLDGLYTRNVNDFFYENRNLTGQQASDRRGRVLYGTIATSGSATPARRNASFNDVIDVVNTSKNYSYNVSVELQRRFAQNLELKTAYAFSRARDAQSLTSSQGISNWRFGRTMRGRHSDQNVGISLFDQPHKVVLTALYTLPRTKTDISVYYIGQSGVPFDYIYNGDVNADGVTTNDLLYVPRSATDTSEIRFRAITRTVGGVVDTTATVAQQQQAFESFIQNSDCLSEQRGRILERNSCRSPWQNYLNLSLRQRIPIMRGNEFAVQFDIFNVLNLLNRDWGQHEFASTFSNVTLVQSVGSTSADPATQQPIVTFVPSTTEYSSRNASSVYQIQLAAKYSFF